VPVILSGPKSQRRSLIYFQIRPAIAICTIQQSERSENITQKDATNIPYRIRVNLSFFSILSALQSCGGVDRQVWKEAVTLAKDDSGATREQQETAA
jgi:hypothetical protein